MDSIKFSVNDEEQSTSEHELDPRTILKTAGYDPDQHYLTVIRGHERDSYKNKPGERIRVHPHMKCLAISCAPTPVS